MFIQNIDRSFGNPISGFERHKSFSEQIEILEEFFQKDFFLNNQQKKMLKKEFLTKKLLLVPFFEDLIKTEIEAEVSHARLLKNVMSALWKKYRSSMEVDNNMRPKYNEGGYRRTSGLVESFAELWHAQDFPESLLIIPFEFIVEENDPKILYKKMFYQNINGEFLFGGYETVVAKIIFGNYELGEDLISVICAGDEVSGNNREQFPNMISLEYDDSGIKINMIPKEYPYSPAAYFKGFVI